MYRNIETIAEYILDHQPGAPAEVRLLRNVFQLPDTDPRLCEATKRLTTNPKVNDLLSHQEYNGSWGRFHSMDSHIYKKYPTTETAIMRIACLGLSSSHTAVAKLCEYCSELYLNKIPFPDPQERNPRWSVGIRMFIAGSIAQLNPVLDVVINEATFWSTIASEVFSDSGYSLQSELRVFSHLLGEKVNFQYLHLNGRYQAQLLAINAQNNPEASWIDPYLRWCFSQNLGLGYLGVALSPPKLVSPRYMDLWLWSHEILSCFQSHWSVLASPALSWLWDQRDDDGLWDFGKTKGYCQAFNITDKNCPIPPSKVEWSLRVLRLLRITMT